MSNDQGFNQIDKRKIAAYVALWSIPDNITDVLKLFTGEVPPTHLNPVDTRRLFLYELPIDVQTKLVNFFTLNKTMIISDLLGGREQYAASWMLICQKNINTWSLLPMSAVVDYYGNGPVRVTSKGSLKIGRVGMQRKGGDNGRESAKMLQFKFNPCEVVNDVN